MEIVRQSTTFGSLKVGDVFVLVHHDAEKDDPHIKIDNNTSDRDNAFNFEKNGKRDVASGDVVISVQAKLVVKAWQQTKGK